MVQNGIWLFETKNLSFITNESFSIVGSGKQVMYADQDFFLMIRRENFVTTAFRDTGSLETICSAAIAHHHQLLNREKLSRNGPKGNREGSRDINPSIYVIIFHFTI